MYEAFIQLLLIIVNDSSKDMVSMVSDFSRLIIHDLQPIFEFQNVFAYINLYLGRLPVFKTVIL